MKSIVILGGADGSLATLRAAKRLGLRTICVDMRLDAPGIREADEPLLVSTRDVDALTASLAGRDDLVGVVSPASDVNLPYLVELTERLQLPCGLSNDALRASVDKGFFREVCVRLGMAQPRFVSGPPDEVAAESRELAFPLIVKPVDQNGGRGIAKCQSPAELSDAIEGATQHSTGGKIIVEEFIDGQDLSIEAFLSDGSVELLGLSERSITPPPQYITLGHNLSPGPAEIADAIRTRIECVCAELGYSDGPLNADVLIAPGGDVVLIEMGARVGGNGMAEALGLMYGVDVVAADILVAMGEKPNIAPQLSRYSASRVLRSGCRGKLIAIRGIEDVLALPEVSDVLTCVEAGDDVEPYTQARAKLGYVLASADDPDDLARVLARIEDLIGVDLAVPN